MGMFDAANLLRKMGVSPEQLTAQFQALNDAAETVASNTAAIASRLDIIDKGHMAQREAFARVGAALSNIFEMLRRQQHQLDQIIAQLPSSPGQLGDASPPAGESAGNLALTDLPRVQPGATLHIVNGGHVS